MTRRWNGKALVDELGERLWDTSSSFRSKILRWLDETLIDIASEQKLPYYKIKTKKLLPAQREIIDLAPEIAGAPTSALASGGNLTATSTYKITITFLVYDSNGKDYIESEQGTYSTERTADASNKTIDLTDIPTMGGDSSYEPSTIYRRVYVATKESGGSYGEPFLYSTIEDNTTTTLSITDEPTSTITPPDDSELEEIASDHMVFPSSNKRLNKVSSNQIKRFDPNSSESTTPDMFDFESQTKITLYPKLSSSATTAQRTLVYSVYRKPHKVFYDVDCEIDAPSSIKTALKAGVIAKAYEYRDRNGVESKLANYEVLKKAAIKKLKRKIGKPNPIRDVNGDTFGLEV